MRRPTSPAVDVGILLAASAGVLLAVLLAPSIRPATQILGGDLEPSVRDEVLPVLPASSSSRVEAVADAARDVSGSTRIRVRDSAGDPIDGANICRATNSRLRYVVDPPILGTTGIDGMAVIEIEDPPVDLLIYRGGFQAGEVPGAARGQFYEVVLADGFDFRGLARLPDGSPVRDATVVLSGYGGIPADDVFPVADSLRPAARQRDAI